MHLGIRDTGSSEDSWSKDGHTSDTNPLLHDLKPDDELNTATSVELARANAEEHSDIRLAFCGLALKLGNVADILEFGLGLANILASLTTKAAKDITSLILTADLDKPSWRLGEEPTDGEKEQQWGDLECDGESPGELALTFLIEIAAAGRHVSF